MRVGPVCTPKTRCGQRHRPTRRVDFPGPRFGVDVHHRWRGSCLLCRPAAVARSPCERALRTGSPERRLHRRSLSREWVVHSEEDAGSAADTTGANNDGESPREPREFASTRRPDRTPRTAAVHRGRSGRVNALVTGILPDGRYQDPPTNRRLVTGLGQSELAGTYAA